MIDVSRLQQLLGEASGKRVVCVGDIMLDRYVYGEVRRVSAEAPIPVLRQGEVRAMLGAAGNVARNVASLGALATLVGVVGEDAAGAEVTLLVGSTEGIEGEIIPARGRPTTIKTRFIAAGQQLLRVDNEITAPIDAVTASALAEAAEAALDHAAVLLVSDYAKGTVTQALVERLTRAAARRGVPVVVDPKGLAFERYGAVDVIKPNASELSAATGLACDTDEEVVSACRVLLGACAAGAVLVTRSARGMTLVTRGGLVEHGPARPLEVFDVSGAGDTSLAAIAVALAGGGDLAASMQLALVASGVAVSKVGTAAVFAEEVLEAAARDELQSRPLGKIADAARAADIADGWRRKGLTVGFTNGCFDVLHAGHVDLLRQARGHCDRLVLGLNTDASVRRLKGESRPVNTQEARAAVLAALATVDLVVLFDQETPIELIRMVRPDVLVKGSDYTVESVVGASEVQGWGGRVVLADLTPGLSTTNTIRRIRNAGRA
jgi:D-beta-D-heptose 7-phosphate kinase/D-beta-D-heptose 1-phosphate adenosyltransferase